MNYAGPLPSHELRYGLPKGEWYGGKYVTGQEMS